MSPDRAVPLVGAGGDKVDPDIPGGHYFDLRSELVLQIFQILVNDMGTVRHTRDGDLQDGTVYFCDVIYDLCRILHNIHDQIHKSRGIVLDQAGVLPGDDNFEICLPA